MASLNTATNGNGASQRPATFLQGQTNREPKVTDGDPARNIPLRGCHPRDLIDQAMSLARYLEQPRRLSTYLLEAACNTYFVDETQGVSTVA